ncbi:MAG: hypothetical protein SPL40_04660 [Erysipelotrichaceae bacterium]|nr:hypothetical protein [Erysipelotrichaceae bacterium]
MPAVNSSKAQEEKTQELVNKLRAEVQELRKAQTWGAFDDKPLFDRIAAVTNYPAAIVFLAFTAKQGGHFIITSDLSHSDSYISICNVKLQNTDSMREAKVWGKAITILYDNGFIECISSTDADVIYKITEEGWDIANEESYSFDSGDYSDSYKMLAEIKE